MRKALIYNKKDLAGVLTETDDGYLFQYDGNYLSAPNAEPVSLTMPLSPLPYKSKVLFPFFDGLIPEGWMLNIAERNWKINRRDRMGLLLTCCRDCIGNVSVAPITTKEER